MHSELGTRRKTKFTEILQKETESTESQTWRINIVLHVDTVQDLEVDFLHISSSALFTLRAKLSANQQMHNYSLDGGELIRQQSS